MMPISRFFGYIDYIGDYVKAQNPDSREARIDKAEKLDWTDEIKQIKKLKVR